MDVGTQLAALADPTRRAIFELVGRSPSAVRDLTAQLTISQPAVSQHLKVLREARLVQARAVGTRRVYRIDGDGLEALRRWLDQMWDDVLDAYAAAASEEATS